VAPVRYELGFYIPEDDILHGDRRENQVLRYKFVHGGYLQSMFLSSGSDKHNCLTPK
jgi:hypothetical protein